MNIFKDISSEGCICHPMSKTKHHFYSSDRKISDLVHKNHILFLYRIHVILINFLITEHLCQIRISRKAEWQPLS